VCTEFDVTQLAEHLIGSVAFLGALAHDAARQIITPGVRGGGSFADPVTPDPDAGLLDRLIAFTGRKP
jgi:hypothetical protein